MEGTGLGKGKKSKKSTSVCAKVPPQKKVGAIKLKRCSRKASVKQRGSARKRLKNDSETSKLTSKRLLL